MTYKIAPGDLSSITLNESDTARSVIQNIALLLSTRKGTVPLYRDFGLSQSFVDKPMQIAKPLIISEIADAILNYEPRASLVGVTFDIDNSVPGKLIPTVEVEINE